MDRQLPYSCYGLLVGGISKQAARESIQKKDDVHSWFKRRIKAYLVPQSVQSSSSWSQQLAIKTARKQLETLIGKMIQWANAHKRKDKRGRKSWTPQMVAKVLGIHIDGKFDVYDVMERYLNRCIDQLIRVKHFQDWEPSLSPTHFQLSSTIRSTNTLGPDIPFEDPFFGAFDR